MKAMETSAEFVPKIMKIVKKIRDKIKIRCVIVCRGFFSVGTLNTLDSLGLTYLIPCKNTTNVIRALNEFAENKRDKVSEMELTSITRNSVKYVMKITERKKKKNPKTSEEEYIGFATNDSTINVSIYSSRWGIETGYRNIESIRIRTRSKNQGAGIFCFLYSVLIYNEWQIARVQCAATGKKGPTLMRFLTAWFDRNQQAAERPPVVAP